MSHTTFDDLPASSRIWVLSSPRELEPADLEAIEQVADKFLKIWKTKAEMIKGCWEVRENRFFLAGSDESEAELSGCSIDAMMARFMKLEQETGLQMIDRMNVYYRDAAGKIQAVSRPEFRKLVGSGEVSEDTHVFDMTISRIESLRDGKFEIPLKESWHAQLFLEQGAAS